MTNAEILEILKKSVKIEVDVKGLIGALVLPLLSDFVKNTSNPYDDKLLEWFEAFLAEKQKEA